MLGDFRILKPIGRGGMGVVYLARDERLDRRVALKVIAPHLAADEEFRERFVSEARSAAAIEHDNAVPVYSAGVVEGVLYIAMRYVDGIDLRAVLAEQGPLDPEEAISIVAEVAAALDAAHAAGLVHRDVKPANILLRGGPGNRAGYLTDFGLTKSGLDSSDSLTGTGQWVGTIDYVAPEQIRAGQVDARADVYALGCVLYEALTGSVPYAGDDMQKMWGHVNEPFPSLPSSTAAADGGSSLAAVVARATAKSPDDRFPSAGDLANAARAALGGESVEAPEHSVATGAAADPGATATARRAPADPSQAPTVAGGRLDPTDGRPQPASPAGRRGGGAPRTAGIVGGAIVVAAGLLAAAVVIAGGDSGSTSTTVTSKQSGGTTEGTGEGAGPTDPTLPPEGDELGDWPGGSGYSAMLGAFSTEWRARDRQEEASARGLDAGVLYSSNFSSLRPGYWVVFSGSFASSSEAAERARRARSLGYTDSYPRFVSQ
jgi:hypothetical protein